MSNLSDDWSDHGECIANADDRMDSEILAELVRKRLALLSAKEIDTLYCVYGEMFRQKETHEEYAKRHGVTKCCVYTRIKKAKKIILMQNTKLMRYLETDDYYKRIIHKPQVKIHERDGINLDRQLEIQCKYEMERKRYMAQLTQECNFRIGTTANKAEPPIIDFYSLLFELKRKGGRKRPL